MKAIGVLALQGCVKPHRPHIEALGFQYREVRRASDFEDLRGLILPGGESTVLLKLLTKLELWSPLQTALKKIPVWGICAGAILLARRVCSPAQGALEQRSLDALDIDIERNAYGRQCASIQSEVGGYPVAFIRAPKIVRIGDSVQVRAERDGNPTWVERGLVMATTFHPELTPTFPSPMHHRLSELAELESYRENWAKLAALRLAQIGVASGR